MLIICAAIGFYFGFIEKKQKKKGQKGGATEQRRGSEALDYLVGGRKMKVFPVSLSLVARYVCEQIFFLLLLALDYSDFLWPTNKKRGSSGGKVFHFNLWSLVFSKASKVIRKGNDRKITQEIGKYTYIPIQKR